MKRILYGFIALAAVVMVTGLFAGSEALAQRGPKHHEPGQRLDRHLQMMDERLDLTDEQETQIRALLEEHAAEMRAWRDDDDSRDERRAHRHESMTALREEVHALLTEEQAEKLKAMHERLQDRPRDHRKANRFEELNLSDAQKEQLRELRETQRAEIKEWREANPEATREDWRERMRSQAEEHRAAMAEILTDEQRQQLEELRAEGPSRRQEWKERRQEKEENWRGRHRQQRSNDQTDNSRADEAAEQAANPFQLENHPNPFNPSTEIRFELPESGPVELTVYDARGREVQSLLNETLSAGPHSVTFEAGDLPSGVYLYRLWYGGQVATGRMTFSK